MSHAQSSLWEMVDIRLAVGEPSGETPIKMICPMHRSRIGVEDDTGSLAVYRANVHCFGCGYHLNRRYASLAFLLGEWDGVGNEWHFRVDAAVKRVKKKLKQYTGNGAGPITKFVPPPVNPMDVEVFHQYLLMDRGKLAELQGKRGLSVETVRRFRLGYTGTHYTIPVPNLEEGYYSIRYRADESVVDTNDAAYRKYDGVWGHNLPRLYPVRLLRGIHSVEELWIVEGEYDALASIQQGSVTLTVTNGATNLPKLPEMVAALLPDLRVNRAVLATDQDAAGEDAANKIMSAWPGRSVRARWGWGKDLTEYYATGGSRTGIVYDR